MSLPKLKGYLDTALEVAENDFPQDGGPEATIQEQLDGALESVREVATYLETIRAYALDGARSDAAGALSRIVDVCGWALGDEESCGEEEEPVHAWFGLSYSSYLVLPRSILQSAPHWWQRAFVWLLGMLAEMFDQPKNEYWVRAKEGGRFVADPLADYERGRRQVPRKGVAA
jgi:hypothetical protein